MKMKPVIPTYAFLTSMNGDYFSALEKVASIGYQYIELLSMNYPAGKRFDELYTAKETREKMRQVGISPLTVHEQLQQKRLFDIDWTPIMDYYQELGCLRFVQPNIWISTEDEAKAWAEDYEKLGEIMHQRGLQLYLHTHHLEWRRLPDGRSLVDIIRENTAPEHLKFEVDVCWGLRGGIDPVAEIKKMGPRCDIIHMKDIMPGYDEETNLFDIMRRENKMEDRDLLSFIQQHGRGQEFFTIMGTGCFDIPGTLKQLCALNHVQYVVAESEEKSNIQFKIARMEYNYLTRHMPE